MDERSQGRNRRRRTKRKRGKPHRLFVAAYPPPEIARAMRQAVEALDLPRHRLVPVEQIHLTLQFIGDTAEKELDRVIESVERSAAGLAACELVSQQLIVLPPRGRARLIALETDAPPSILEIHSRLVRRLARKARSDPGDRYLPHFTLCRFKPPVALSVPQSSLEIPPFPVHEIHLMRSVLKPEGAQHAAVRSFPLAAP